MHIFFQLFERPFFSTPFFMSFFPFSTSCFVKREHKQIILKKGKRLMRGHTKRKKCRPPPKTGNQKPPNRLGNLKMQQQESECYSKKRFLKQILSFPVFLFDNTSGQSPLSFRSRTYGHYIYSLLLRAKYLLIAMKGNELIVLYLQHLLHITDCSRVAKRGLGIQFLGLLQNLYLLQQIKHEMMKFLMMTDEWPFSDNIAMVFKVHGA